MTGSGLDPQARFSSVARSRVSAGDPRLRPSGPDHSVVCGQLDLFADATLAVAAAGAYDEPAGKPRNSQMSELAGTTWEEAFGRSAA